MRRYLSPWYGQMMMVSRCSSLKTVDITQEGVINSWARLSDASGHGDVTAKWSVRRAEFSKMAVLLFFMWTLWAYFSREWSSNVVSLLIEDTIISYSNERSKCILITTWKFCKKGFWSVLVSAVRHFAQKKIVFLWIKSKRKLVASLQSSL